MVLCRPPRIFLGDAASTACAATVLAADRGTIASVFPRNKLYLARALGMDHQVEIDIRRCSSKPATCSCSHDRRRVRAHRFRPRIASAIARMATISMPKPGPSSMKHLPGQRRQRHHLQIVRIDEPPAPKPNGYRRFQNLPCPPLLEARMESTATRSSARSRPAAAAIFTSRPTWIPAGTRRRQDSRHRSCNNNLAALERFC